MPLGNDLKEALKLWTSIDAFNVTNIEAKMHRWLFHVINSQQIPKPAVLGSAGFTSFNLHFVSRDGAWIRLHGQQVGDWDRLRCRTSIWRALLQLWWRWKEAGFEGQLFLTLFFGASMVAHPWSCQCDVGCEVVYTVLRRNCLWILTEKLTDWTKQRKEKRICEKRKG